MVCAAPPPPEVDETPFIVWPYTVKTAHCFFSRGYPQVHMHGSGNRDTHTRAQGRAARMITHALGIPSERPSDVLL